VCSLAAETTTATAAAEVTTASPATTSAATARPPPTTVTTAAVASSVAGATDRELADFAERLLALDENNVADKIVLNTGCTTRVGSPNDCSTNRLFAQVIKYRIM
jgi:hypothetical protein